jgi:hypothetical protein
MPCFPSITPITPLCQSAYRGFYILQKYSPLPHGRVNNQEILRNPKKKAKEKEKE